MTDSELPDVFRREFAGLEEQIVAPRPSDTFHHCFGCGPAHPTGLHVRCFRTAGGVASPIVIPHEYEGPPRAAHGGIVAAYLDEVLGAAAVRASGRPAVTGELTVRYIAPVPAGVPLIGRGRLVAHHGRYVDVEGHLEIVTTAKIVASARGRFFPVKE